MTKFGMDKSDILDTRWGKKAAETTPGPGAYGRFSEFAGENQWLLMIHQHKEELQEIKTL